MATRHTHFVGTPATHVKYLPVTERTSLKETPISGPFVEPAWLRTPVEIWQRILELAVHTGPSYPCEEDGFIANLSVFDNECAIMATYHAVEVIRGRLRLVCKSWNEFLKYSSSSFAPVPLFPVRPATAPADESLAIANRIQMIYRPFTCICPSRCYLSRRWRQAKPTRTFNEYRLELDNIIEKCGELPAQILRCDISRSHDLQSVGEAFPRLRVLSTLSNRGDWSIKLAQYFPLLTHLDVDNNIHDTFRSGLDLPSLATLSIRLLKLDMSVNDDGWPTPSGWNLPGLKYLSIEGLFGRGFVRTHVDTLLQSCGTTLKGLIIVQYDRRNDAMQGFTFPDQLWELCPNLQSLGGSAQSLLRAPRPPTNAIVEAVIVTSLFGPVGWELGDAIRETADIVAAYSEWRFERFDIRVSWERFWLQFQDDTIYKRAEWINFLAQFGLFGQRHGQPLRDANGVAFDEKEADQIRQSIQMETAILADRLRTTSWTNKLSRSN
jgi:hypothetical protein